MDIALYEIVHGWHRCITSRSINANPRTLASTPGPSHSHPHLRLHEYVSTAPRPATRCPLPSWRGATLPLDSS